MTVELWVEKYRPKQIDEYVWRDASMREMVEEWVKKDALPHLLLSGVSGTGKTSLALLLMRLLNIPAEDILMIHASRERKIEDLQDKIVSFINSWAFGKSGIKYIIMDEADKLSQHAQGFLRTEMEAYASSSRFIMSCNYPNKIIPALHSRMQEIKFSTLQSDEFMLRLIKILEEEGITFTTEILFQYYQKTYPDLRKAIGMLQQNSVHSVLNAPQETDEEVQDYIVKAIELFKESKYVEARKLIVAQADVEDYESLYRWLYQNLSLFGPTQRQQDEALLIIRKAIVYDTQVADREINVSACLVELSRIAQG